MVRVLLFAAALLPGLAGCTDQAEPTFETLPVEAWKARFESTPGAFLLDVRTLEEFEVGHIPNATLVPYDALPAETSRLPPDPSTSMFVYCRTGHRSAIASQTLVDRGYGKVVNLGGGFNDWAAAGFPTASGSP